MNRPIIRVKDLRADKGWTQEHLAEVAGVSARTIQRIERGEPMGAETAMAMANAFAIPVEALWSSDEQGKPTMEDLEFLAVVRRELKKQDPRIILLARQATGPLLLDALRIGKAECSRNSYDPPRSAEEAEIVGNFMQTIHDYGDIWDDMEPGLQARESFALTEQLEELHRIGYCAFAGTRSVIVTLKNPPLLAKSEEQRSPMRWLQSILVLRRHDAKEIQNLPSGYQILPAIIQDKEGG